MDTWLLNKSNHILYYIRSPFWAFVATISGTRTWIINYVDVHCCDIIIHTWHNINGSLVKLLFKSGYGRVITSHRKQWISDYLSLSKWASAHQCSPASKSKKNIQAFFKSFKVEHAIQNQNGDINIVMQQITPNSKINSLPNMEKIWKMITDGAWYHKHCWGYDSIIILYPI